MADETTNQAQGDLSQAAQGAEQSASLTEPTKEPDPLPLVPVEPGSRPGDLKPDPNLPNPLPPWRVDEPSAPQSAKERLRAFEDATFGADAPRLGGDVERGRGSPFAAMDAGKRAHYQALENLVEAEKKVADTSAALASAEAAHEAAMAAVAAREADVPAES